jgi:hypothetical protein
MSCLIVYDVLAMEVRQPSVIKPSIVLQTLDGKELSISAAGAYYVNRMQNSS